MRLRKKPWISEAIKEYADFVMIEPGQEVRGKWAEVFGRVAPLYVELGTGKGRFISELAEYNPTINFIGIEAQQDVLYYAAQKVAEKGLKNVKLLVFDINHIMDIFSQGEVTRFYINFCDPWPKFRHAKRRLTHNGFLKKYRSILGHGGELFFKTDNRALFEFSLEQFKQEGLLTKNVTFNLHEPAAPGHTGNIMTEYENKFSSLGITINRAEVIFL